MRIVSKVLLILILVININLAFTSDILADYSSINLSPSSGQIIKDVNDYITVILDVNSGTDEYIGIDTNISYTGPIEFIDGTGIKCGSFVATNSSGVINVECFYLEGGTYVGQVASLRFRVTGTGSSTFSIVSTDPVVTTKSNVTYTINSSSDEPETTIPSGEPETTIPSGDRNTSTTLPATGLIEERKLVILVGMIFLLLGIGINRSTQFPNSFKPKTERTRITFEKRF